MILLITNRVSQHANTDVCSVLVRPFPEFIDPELQQTLEERIRFTQHRNQPDKRLQRRTKQTNSSKSELTVRLHIFWFISGYFIFCLIVLIPKYNKLCD